MDFKGILKGIGNGILNEAKNFNQENLKYKEKWEDIFIDDQHQQRDGRAY